MGLEIVIILIDIILQLSASSPDTKAAKSSAFSRHLISMDLRCESNFNDGVTIQQPTATRLMGARTLHSPTVREAPTAKKKKIFYFCKAGSLMGQFVSPFHCDNSHIDCCSARNTSVYLYSSSKKPARIVLIFSRFQLRK